MNTTKSRIYLIITLLLFIAVQVSGNAVQATALTAPDLGESEKTANQMQDKKVFLPFVTHDKPTYFSLRSPGSKLPSDPECAALVKKRPENKKGNVVYNATKANQRLPADFFGGSDPRANSEIGPRVTGDFVGTTDEILQWVACKWGADEDMVKAQAAVETWWRQPVFGDWTSNADNCAPGHGIGADGKPGLCPESFGILQNRYPYEKGAWPGIKTSTAFNADTAYAYWRACYEGYEYWLNYDGKYRSGDAWGCVGRWYSGRWYNNDANNYIGVVKDYLKNRVWESPGFQEP
jgi:hypothetical protein